MSGLSRTPGKRVYGESRTVGSNPTLSATESAIVPAASQREDSHGHPGSFDRR